jgi:DNA-binding GntR family transcriptional regulator
LGESASSGAWRAVRAWAGYRLWLEPNRPIPSEAQIQQEFGVARETARRAVALLREEGYVVTVPGLGTYVRRRQRPASPED